MIYIITYDLNNEIRRPPIVEFIKKIGGWAKLSESSYAVSTEKSSSEVFNALKQLIDSDDQLYVISLSLPWSGYGPNEVNGWLDRNLK